MIKGINIKPQLGLKSPRFCSMTGNIISANFVTNTNFISDSIRNTSIQPSIKTMIEYIAQKY